MRKLLALFIFMFILGCTSQIKQGKEEVSDYTDPPKKVGSVYSEPLVGSEYYQNLLKQCETKQSPNCCTSSVNNMIAGNYTLADESGNCPTNYGVNALRCADTFKWCEPT